MRPDPEPRSLESPSASGFFFGLCFCAAVFLISATVLRRCFFDLCDSSLRGGKRSDIVFRDLIQSVPEPRSLESPSASGFFFGLCFCAAVFLISATVVSARRETLRHLFLGSHTVRTGTPKPGVSIGVRLLLRALFLRRCFFDLCDSLSTVLAGKRSDIYSWDLIQSVPEPRSLESPKPGVSIGVRLLLRALFLRRGFFDLCDSQALSPLWACRRRTHTTMTTRMKMTKRMTTRKTKSPQSSENRTNSSRAIASNELNAD